MVITALANAGAALRSTEWDDAAIKAFDFVVKALGDGDRLHHSWRDGKRGHRASPTTMRTWRARRSRCGKRPASSAYLDRAKAGRRR